MPFKGPEPGDEKGLALIITLLVVVLLTVLILEFDFSTRTDLLAARNFRDGTQALFLAQSGLAAAKAVLRDDIRQGSQYDAFDELWAIPFPPYPVGSGTVIVSIQDEGGKLNPNDLVNIHDRPVPKKVNQLRRLFELLEVDPDLVEAVIDWIDENERPQPNGAESDYYRRQDPPYLCKNAKLSVLSELHLVRGVTDSVYEKIAPYLTVHSLPIGEGPINLNTAEGVVLQTLPSLKEEGAFPITEDLAREIMEARPIAKKGDLKKVSGVSTIYQELDNKYYVTKSHYFTIFSSGEVSGLLKTLHTVIKREGSRIRTVYYKVE